MQYKASIFNNQTKEFIVPESVMTGNGIMAVLKYMTDLNRDERNAFMYELQRTGTSTYIPTYSAKLQYAVGAVAEQTSA